MNDQFSQPGRQVNRSMPPGTIIPELAYADVRTAVAWLCTAFGFSEWLRIGDHRSQLVFGDASVIVVAQHGGAAPESADLGTARPRQTQVSHALMVRVEDVDRHYAHVSQSGALIISSPTDFPYGERQYTAEDLGGHRWTFSQAIADVDPQEWGGLLTETALTKHRSNC
jgi:uncharacterized glyoxalase superfamily protein PhnB